MGVLPFAAVVCKLCIKVYALNISSDIACHLPNRDS